MNLLIKSVFKSIVLLLSFSLMVVVAAAQVSQFIHTDQFGYHVNADKVAVLSNPVTGYNAALSYTPPTSIQLRDASNNLVVFTANISQWNSGNTHGQSGDKGWWYDFTAFETPGSYYVYDPVNNERSAVFAINHFPYGDVLKTAGRAFYYNRCNTPKLPAHAGAQWSDATSFLNPLQDANCRYIHDRYNASLERNLAGGWFDAGDYNKYVTFTYTTLHDLLYAWEESPDVFGDDWNIPESDNGIPDLIDEIKWELDWLMKMTNPDGSVQIKMGSQNYSQNISSPPSANTNQRFYGPTCTSASATVASVFAHAGIVFSNFPEFGYFSADLSEIAESTFLFTLPHYTNNTFETNCDNGEIVSGDADKSAQEQKDMMISAAVYLFEFTGNSIYNTFVINNYTQSKPWVDNFWGPYTMPVQDALLRYTTLPGANATVVNNIKTKASAEANNNWNGFYGWSTNDLYRAFMPDWSYHWGSNTTKACYGNLNNRLADLGISNVNSLRKKATELLHYFHGVNPQGMVYLSNMYNFGADRSANEIYHTWFNDGTVYDNALTSLYGPAPGFLTGGANKDFSVGSIVPPAGQPAQKSYKDWNTGWPQNSWEITEPAIYCQAAYLRLLARVMQSSLKTHQISLSEGWNGLSSYIMPSNNDVKNVFNPVNNAFIIAQTMTGVYYPAFPVNTIGDWISQSAYKVKMSNQAVLTVTGYEEMNKTIDLSPGWNLIPVICNIPAEVTSLFSGTNVKVLKDVTGLGVYWPEFEINTLGNLHPGRAYYVCMNTAGQIVYPDNAEESLQFEFPSHQFPNHPWNEVSMTASSHQIAIISSGMEGVQNGDVLGVFDESGNCFGVLALEVSDKNQVITAYANDGPGNSKTGFEEGNLMQYKLYRHKSLEVMDVVVIYDPQLPQQQFFQNEGLSAISSLKVSNVGIDETSAANIQIFPNPATGMVTISGITQFSSIEFYASGGNLIKTIQTSNVDHLTIDIEGLSKGVYQLRFTGSESSVYKKLFKN